MDTGDKNYGIKIYRENKILLDIEFYISKISKETVNEDDEDDEDDEGEIKDSNDIEDEWDEKRKKEKEIAHSRPAIDGNKICEEADVLLKSKNYFSIKNEETEYKISTRERLLKLYNSANISYKEVDDLLFNLNLKATDSHYLFSFFGENGIGKTTICKEFSKDFIEIKEERKNNSIQWLEFFFKDNYNIDIDYKKYIKNQNDLKCINIQEYLKLPFYANCVFATNQNRFYFYEFLYNDNLDKIKGNINENCEIVEDVEITEEFDKISELIYIWSRKNNIDIYDNCDYEKENPISIFTKKIEKKAIEEKINLKAFLSNYIHHPLKESEKLLEILIDNDNKEKILGFLIKVLFKIKDERLRSKREMQKNEKLISELLLEKYNFELLSNSFLNEIVFEHEYNSFLEMGVHEVFIINRRNIKQKLHEFLTKISEGQLKLIKLYFIFSFVKSNADKDTIIIADDIFDSFDNKNILNILILMKKAIDVKKPILISFTHDFEIFKIINKQLKVKSESSKILLRKDNEIFFSPFEITKGTFEEYIKTQIRNSANTEILSLYFIVMLVYSRNLFERTSGVDSVFYKKITSILHVKKDTDLIIPSILERSDFHLMKIFTKNNIEDIQHYYNKHDDFFSFLNGIFVFSKIQNINNLELNIFLSLYARILIENIILKNLKEKGFDIENILSCIKEYQTGELIRMYKRENTVHDKHLIALNNYITNFIHIEEGISYLINIDSKVLLKLIDNIK